MSSHLSPVNRSPTPYPDLNAVLVELVESVRAILGDSFTGAYLQGSFAVGDFDRDSDVDWIVAVECELTGEQLEALQAMHERIYRLESKWAQHLEGSYFPRDVLRTCAQRARPLWYLDNGSRSLIESVHDNTAVVRSVLRHHGVVLVGPSAATLIDSFSVSVLRREILEVMHGWAREFLADPEPINNRFYQGFVTLSYCRMLHDLHTGFCGSKRGGAEWAKAHLDPAWAGLIDRAWSTRPDPAVSVRTPADPQELESTLAFVRYVLAASAPYAAALEADTGSGAISDVENP